MDTSPSVALKAMMLDIENVIDDGVIELYDELIASTPVYTGLMKNSWEVDQTSNWTWTITNDAQDKGDDYPQWVFIGQSKSRWNGMAVVARGEKMIKQDLANLGVY